MNNIKEEKQVQGCFSCGILLFWLLGDWDMSQVAVRGMKFCGRAEKSRLSEGGK